MLTPDDIRALRLYGTETKDGFKLTLDTKMTDERSSETSWKKLFNERYVSVVFGDVEPIEDEFPVKRDFKLTQIANIAKFVHCHGSYRRSSRHVGQVGNHRHRSIAELGNPSQRR